MSHNRILSLCLVLLVSSVVAGQEPAKGEIDMAKIMAEMMKMATPGPEHQELAKMVGTWTAQVKARMSPDAPWQEEKGEAICRAILGGRYILQEMKTSFGGMPMEGIQILGYDKLKKCYTALWMDSMSTWVVHSTGTKDPSGKVVHQGSMIDVITPEGRPFRSATEFVSDDKIVFTMFDTIDGKEVQVMEVTYTRKAG